MLDLMKRMQQKLSQLIQIGKGKKQKLKNRVFSSVKGSFRGEKGLSRPRW